MKIVTAPIKQEDAKEMYKVGNVIYDGIDYYLIAESEKGYALVGLGTNSILVEKGSLSELGDAYWSEEDKLVDAELTIID